ncbi:unnamed protein product [marine sediment metagenome]|uniref:Uncharacterized protein n=1 Tax=marine sediment metagenome TaxID=412755 RepID=X0UZU2_9ZZZZ
MEGCTPMDVEKETVNYRRETLRDKFAVAALTGMQMAGMPASNWKKAGKKAAALALKIADGMIA